MRTRLLPFALTFALAAQAAPSTNELGNAAGVAVGGRYAVEDIKNWCVKNQPAQADKAIAAYSNWIGRHTALLAKADAFMQAHGTAEIRAKMQVELSTIADALHKQLASAPPAEQTRACSELAQRLASPQANMIDTPEVANVLMQYDPASEGNSHLKVLSTVRAGQTPDKPAAGDNVASASIRPNNPRTANRDARECLTRDSDAAVRVCAEKFR